jgi:acyl dehydratase
MMNSNAGALAWPQVGEKLALRVFGPFLQDHLHAYAAASDDDNPIHLDHNMARRAGLATPPVHGMLVMSCFRPALASWRSDLRIARLSGKFVQPLLRGECVEISGRVVQSRESDSPLAIMRLMAHSERRTVVILAEATLVPRAESFV